VVLSKIWKGIFQMGMWSNLDIGKIFTKHSAINSDPPSSLLNEPITIRLVSSPIFICVCTYSGVSLQVWFADNNHIKVFPSLPVSIAFFRPWHQEVVKPWEIVLMIQITDISKCWVLASWIWYDWIKLRKRRFWNIQHRILSVISFPHNSLTIQLQSIYWKWMHIISWIFLQTQSLFFR